jgi:hypothetical protein
MVTLSIKYGFQLRCGLTSGTNRPVGLGIFNGIYGMRVERELRKSTRLPKPISAVIKSLYSRSAENELCFVSDAYLSNAYQIACSSLKDDGYSSSLLAFSRYQPACVFHHH